MKFMLMMNTPRGTGDFQVSSWSPEDLKAHIAFMHCLNDELKNEGELVSAEGLTPPNQAKLVRAGKNGGPPATDSVFPESKEFLADSGSSRSTRLSAPTRSRPKHRRRRVLVASR